MSQERISISNSSRSGNGRVMHWFFWIFPVRLNRNENCTTHWRGVCKHAFQLGGDAIPQGPGSDPCAGHAIHTVEGANLLSRDRSVVLLAMPSTSPTGRAASSAAIACLRCPDRLRSCASISANPARIPASATRTHQPKGRSPIAYGIPPSTANCLKDETHAVVGEAHLWILGDLAPQLFISDRASEVQCQMG